MKVRWLLGGCDGQLGDADGIMSSAMQMCFPVECRQPATPYLHNIHSINFAPSKRPITVGYCMAVCVGV